MASQLWRPCSDVQFDTAVLQRTASWQIRRRADPKTASHASRWTPLRSAHLALRDLVGVKDGDELIAGNGHALHVRRCRIHRASTSEPGRILDTAGAAHAAARHELPDRRPASAPAGATCAGLRRQAARTCGQAGPRLGVELGRAEVQVAGLAVHLAGRPRAAADVHHVLASQALHPPALLRVLRARVGLGTGLGRAR